MCFHYIRNEIDCQTIERFAGTETNKTLPLAFWQSEINQVCLMIKSVFVLPIETIFSLKYLSFFEGFLIFCWFDWKILRTYTLILENVFHFKTFLFEIFETRIIPKMINNVS